MSHSMMGQHSIHAPRPRGITLVAVLMIVFGLAEVVTSFTHSFLGITTSQTALFTASAAAIGACYVVAGVLILTMRRAAAALAIMLLIADILGRLALVVTGLYPLNSLEQVIGIIGGTALAVIFALYIRSKWRAFE